MYDMYRLYTVDYNRNIYKRNDATGLASHWLCVTDNSGLSRVQRSIKKGDDHTAYAPSEYGRQ